MSSYSFVETTEYEDGLRVDRHAHGQVAGRPGGFGMEVDQPPHVQVDVVHFDGVGDLLLVELSAAREHIYVLVVEYAACSTVSSHIQVCYPAPSIILNVVFLACGVEGFGIVAANHEYETSFRVEGGEVRTTEEQGRSVGQHLFRVDVLHHPVATHVVLVTTADTKHSAFVRHHGATELGNVKLILKVDLMCGLFVYVEEVYVFGAPLEVVHKLAGAIALLKYERVLQQFTELVYHVNVRVVRYPARKLPQFPFFSHQILPNLLQRGPNAFETEEVKVV